MLRVWLLAFIIMGSSLIATSSHAQDQCPDPDKADREAVVDLFKDIRNPSATVPTSVADFIKLLPDGMRSNYALMTESRSFQESTYTDPRVLMKSENAGVIASFTGHGRDDKLRGTEKLEFIVWNGPEARYDFYEVDFPAEDPYKNPATMTEAQKRPVVKQNPASCLNCHGSSVGTGDTVDTNGELKYVQGALGDKVLDSSNARPNWDTYNFWQGQLPFNRDTLYRDSEESRRYLALLKKMEGKPVEGEERNPRLEALKPRISSEELARVLQEDGEFPIPDYQNGDGPGVSMFDQSSRLNFCRIAQNLKKTPFYENIKYAIPAAVQGCDMTTILPPEAREYSDQYFRRQGISSYPALEEQTGNLQQSVAADKSSRQRQTFTRLFAQNNPGMAEAEIAALVETELNRRGEMENREVPSNAQPLAALRYLLEPMGVQVANWSMTIDSGTYSFADVLNLSGGAFDNPEGLSCEQMAQRTSQSFFSTRPQEFRQAYLDACEQATMPVSLEGFSAQNLTIAATQVNQNAQQVFASCIGCHKSGAMGAPRLPFNDLPALTELIRSSAAFPNGGLGASIINRINKPEGAKGHMPMGPRTLTTEEKQYVRDFIGLARGQ